MKGNGLGHFDPLRSRTFSHSGACCLGKSTWPGFCPYEHDGCHQILPAAKAKALVAPARSRPLGSIYSATPTPPLLYALPSMALAKRHTQESEHQRKEATLCPHHPSCINLVESRLRRIVQFKSLWPQSPGDPLTAHSSISIPFKPSR